MGQPLNFVEWNSYFDYNSNIIRIMVQNSIIFESNTAQSYEIIVKSAVHIILYLLKPS